MRSDHRSVFRYRILGSFPNSYAFTKCLSEHLVVEQMEAGMPCVIARPSIGQCPISGDVKSVTAVNRQSASFHIRFRCYSYTHLEGASAGLDGQHQRADGLADRCRQGSHTHDVLRQQWLR